MYFIFSCLLLFVSFFSSYALGAINVIVDCEKKLIEVDDNFFGANVNYASGAFSDNFVDNLNFKSFRWPGGITSYYYLWSKPNKSYKRRSSVGVISLVDFLTKYANQNKKILFQTNTYRYYSIRRNRVDRVKLNKSSIVAAARYASQWVSQVRSRGYPGMDWEIGNEDWSLWSGAEYSSIVNEYAERMLHEDGSIRIAVSGITGRWEDVDGMVWMENFLSNVNKKLVAAISFHAYLSGYVPGEKMSPRKEISNLLAQTSSDLFYVNELSGLVTKYELNWELWCTEFNILQRSENGARRKVDGIDVLQDLGHGLVIYDWVGRLLESGVRRLYYHTLSSNPVFTLVDTTAASPTLTSPGIVYDHLAKYVSGYLVESNVEGAPHKLTGTYIKRVRPRDYGAEVVTINYSELGVYSTIDGKKLNVFLINRSLTDSLNVSLVLSNVGQISKIEKFTFGDSGDVESKENLWVSEYFLVSDLKNIIMLPHCLVHFCIELE